MTASNTSSLLIDKVIEFADSNYEENFVNCTKTVSARCPVEHTNKASYEVSTYCKYLSDNEKRIQLEKCKVPIHERILQCECCLDEIHYADVTNSYACPNSCFVYICKYTHKYASEIYDALACVDFTNKEHLNILSFGCGPATELCTLDYLYQNNHIPLYSYTGIDHNNNWEQVHTFYKENIIEESKISFVIQSVSDFVENNSLLEYDVIIMNYFLSDMVKYSSKQNALEFIQILKEKFVELNHFPIIVYNDLNLNFPDKGSLDMVINELYSLDEYNKVDLHCFYNEKKKKQGKPEFSYNNLFTVIDDNSMYFTPLALCKPYAPYRTQSAAQIILQQRQENDT